MSELAAETISLRLKPSRQYPFLARHPWVHAHALADTGDHLEAGQVIELLDHDGNWIARGVINPNSRLRVRLYSFDASIAVGDELWQKRLREAIDRRRLMEPFDPETAERLVFSESDLLSGLIVDRYANCLGVQFTSGALWRWQESILSQLKSLTGCEYIMVRVDEKTAKHEGIESAEFWYQDRSPEGRVSYQQNGLQLSVDLRSGQKTGSYLDQRLNHLVVAEYLKGLKVLDVCCYTGGFGLVAAKHGAKQVQSIDSSRSALEEGQNAANRNGINGMEFIEGDCFDTLKSLVDAGEQYEAVILDPPRFAGSRHQIDRALRAYAKLNSLAIDLLKPGGLLATCSCSGRVSRSDFLNMLMDVAKRKRRDLILLENRGPSPDHPVSISCPESDYLKCVILQVG
ncbi:class I SAM-dependent rRNA methyltransferase [Rubripirellula sp.]|nr:class I SAM-dependent rRNA methyltransferase [Rhodopirellula sp.]MDA9840741.1 class I SAM-dependent rRNA methyltransferase [Rubripirellula sp.]